MLGRINKVLLIFISLMVFNASANAMEMCTLEGDFVPWPWSEQYSNKVLDNNWIMVDEKGNPTSEIVIKKTTFLWGWGGTVYTLIESDMSGNRLSWGSVRASRHDESTFNLEFEVWPEVPPMSSYDKSLKYSLNIGYWKMASDQITQQDASEINSFGGFGSENYYKVCGDFKQRSDEIVGLIVKKQFTNSEGREINEIFHGLTQQPIYYIDKTDK